MYICFTDIEIAFDRINKPYIWKLIKNMYENVSKHNTKRYKPTKEFIQK